MTIPIGPLVQATSGPATSPRSAARTPRWARCTALSSGQGVRVPNGFALTADVYRSALTAAGAWPRLAGVLRAWAPMMSAGWPSPRPRRGRSSMPRPAPTQVRAADRRKLSPARGRVRRRRRRSPCAARPPPRICRRRASPASTRASSTCAASTSWSRPAAAASPRCSPTAPSSIATTTASII